MNWLNKSSLLILFFCQYGSAKAPADYPPYWGNFFLKSGEECQSLTGVYEYFGEEGRVEKYVKHPRLDLLGFLQPMASTYPESVRIEHAVGSESMSIAIRHRGGAIKESKVAIHCRDGWSEVIHRRSSSANGESGEVISVEYSRMAKSEDGALIVHFNYDIEVRHIFLFSTTRKGAEWYRFRFRD